MRYCKTTILTTLFVLAIPIAAICDEEIDIQLNKQQKALQADIEHSLVAPCCWNMTVDQHESPASKQVRHKISELIQAGKNKEEILTYFSSQPKYGERILATPSQKTLLGKSAYWLIPIAMLFGAIVVAVTIRNWSKSKPKKITKTPTVVKGKTGEKSTWDQRVEDELKSFDV